MDYLNKISRKLISKKIDLKLGNILWFSEKLIFILLLTLAISLQSCSPEQVNVLNKNHDHYKILDDVEPIYIPIQGELSERSSEISGMCWYGEKLIILPQYPSQFGDELGKIFFIEKSKILKSISGNNTELIEPDYFSIDLTEF
ncbi:MAG: hypothetical protein OQJ81_03325, partial [Melioribacteraceae bacterium]|nr:hypothetical protein [Melioribacteraceae bacterium]